VQTLWIFWSTWSTISVILNEEVCWLLCKTRQDSPLKRIITVRHKQRNIHNKKAGVMPRKSGAFFGNLLCPRIFPGAFLERLCPRNSRVFFSQIFCSPEIPWSNSNPLRERLFRSAMSSYIVMGVGGILYE